MTEAIPPRWLWNGGVPVKPPATAHAGPVWPFHPVPLDLSESCKLGEISDRYLAAYSEGMREPRFVPTRVRPTPDAEGSAPDLPGTVGPVRELQGNPSGYLITYPLRVRLEVLRPSQEVRGALLDVYDRQLAAWEGPEDELDVFVGTLAHAFLLRISRILSE